MEIRASGKFLHVSAKKVNPVASIVRGAKVAEAISRCEFSNRKAGRLLAKVINSAVANATHNYKLSADSLRVKEVLVGEGPRMKRIRFSSRGHVNPYHKHTAHISVILDSLVAVKKPQTAVKAGVSHSKAELVASEIPPVNAEETSQPETTAEENIEDNK